MALVEVGVASVRPRIELAGESGQRERLRKRPVSARAYEKIALVVDSMTIGVRNLCLDSSADSSQQARFQGYVVGTRSVRQVSVIRVVEVDRLAVDRITADQFPAH